MCVGGVTKWRVNICLLDLFWPNIIIDRSYDKEEESKHMGITEAVMFIVQNRQW